MKPLRSDKEDGVSNVVSMLLMLTVLVIALSLASATYIPDLKENAEIIHSSEVRTSFLAFAADVNHQHASGYVSPASQVFSLGGGDILLSPAKSSGTVSLTTESLGSLSLSGVSPITINTVNLTYIPHLSVWNSPGFSYEKGVCWVTEDGIRIPALGSINTEKEADAYSEKLVKSWVSNETCLHTVGEKSGIHIVSLEADPSANYASGSQDVVITIMPDNIEKYSADVNSVSFKGTGWTLPEGTTVYIHHGLVSVR